MKIAIRMTACFLALAFSLTVAAHRLQDSGPDLPTRVKTLEEKVAEMQKAIDLGSEQRLMLTQALQEEKSRGDELADSLDKIGAAARKLIERIEASRTGGFLMAGPNPDAKKELLDGLQSFAQSVDAARAAKKVEGEAEKAAREKGRYKR